MPKNVLSLANYVSYTTLAILSVDLLATSGDITMTWTSPVYPKLESNDSSINPLGRPITKEEDSWIGSLINIGAIFGPLPFGYIAEKFGRKIGLLSIAVPHIVSYLTMAFAENIYLFYFARLLGGLAVGAGYALLPMYIAEIAEDSRRGLYSVTLGMFWCFGNLIPLVIGPFVSIQYFNIILTSVPLLFVVSFAIFGTETPYYLVGKNKMDEAENVLVLLRSSSVTGVEAELRHIKAIIKNETQGRFFDIISNRGLRKAFIICELLIIFQQCSGINAIFFYQQPIFQAAGTKLPSGISAMIPAIFSFLFSFIIPFVIERFGRKTLFIFSSIGMSIPLGGIGLYFFLKEKTSYNVAPIFWLPLVSLIVFYFAIAMGVGVLPWTITSELFPKNVKQISAASVSTTCYITSFIITKCFHNLEYGLGTGGTFWLFSGSCLLASLFALVFVPETKGKSFLEIQEMLQR